MLLPEAVTREELGRGDAGCNATDDGLPKCSVSRQVAPTYRFRGVYHGKRDRYLSQRRRAGRKTGLAPKSLPGGLAPSRSPRDSAVSVCYLEPLNTIGAGCEPERSRNRLFVAAEKSQ